MLLCTLARSLEPPPPPPPPPSPRLACHDACGRSRRTRSRAPRQSAAASPSAASPCGARDGEQRTQARESRSTEEEVVPIIESRIRRRLPCHPPTTHRATARPPSAGAHARAVPRGDACLPACLPACPGPPACLHALPSRPPRRARRPPGASDHHERLPSSASPRPALRQPRGGGGPRGRPGYLPRASQGRAPEPWVAPASTVCKPRSLAPFARDLTLLS